MNEKVDIIITTYGRSTELKRAIYSVLNQTYLNINVIIVDDNIDLEISRNVKKIIDNICDDRIVYIKNEKNLGGALSRNVGIHAATSNYVCFLDDDDEYLPDKVEKQLQLFNNSADDKLALVYCYCDGIKNGKIVSHYKYDYTGSCLFEAMKMCIAATSQWMCKREYLLDVECFSDVPCKQDSTVIIKLLSSGYTIDRVPEVLSLYHEEDIPRISSKNIRKRIDGETKLLELCRKNYDKIDLKKQREIEYIFATILVLYYYDDNDKINYKKSLKKIISIHPFRIYTIKIYYYIVKKHLKRIINRIRK